MRQDAFVLTELGHSDDEHSAGCSAFGYHRCELCEWLYCSTVFGQEPWILMPGAAPLATSGAGLATILTGVSVSHVEA